MNAHPEAQFQPDAIFVACRELWCAVIMQAWKDALSSPPRNARREKLFVVQARNWFGSADFYHVCALAGIDGDQMLSGYLRASGKAEVA